MTPLPDAIAARIKAEAKAFAPEIIFSSRAYEEGATIWAKKCIELLEVLRTYKCDCFFDKSKGTRICLEKRCGFKADEAIAKFEKELD